MKNLLSIILPFVIVASSQASLLRGWHSSNNSQNTSDTFDCSIFEVDGIAVPGTDLIPSWTCEVEGTESSNAEIFNFAGDIEGIMRERFDLDITTAAGLKVTVPWDAVVNGTSIMSEHEGITISDRERNLLVSKAPLRGSTKVLIVRVIDTKGNAPKNYIDNLKDDFFQDDNNLKSRISACSNGLLNIIPATGSGVNNGIVNVKVDGTINGKLWRDAGSLAATKLARMSINYDIRIYILPDVVNFVGAAAYAQVGGNTMWVKDEYASTPSVQVHEYGHLLGARHSGRNGISYADNTCYMGNQVPWTDHGAYMCFNPAKTWHFGWYSSNHRTVSPLNSAFNGDLVGIDDVSKGRAGSRSVVVKIDGDSNTYFLMYNRKKGINSEAIGGADQVVITKQNGSNQESSFVEALGDKMEWTSNNFANSGRQLVVKLCYTNDSSNGDTARVLIYIKGKNDQYCGNATGNTGGGNSGGGNSGGGNSGGGGSGGGGSGGNNGGKCTDKNWKDKYNDSCSWYANGSNRCTTFGGAVGTNNWTAKQACCVCGGGNRSSSGNSGNSSSGGNNGGNNGGNSSGNGNNNSSGNGGNNNNGSCKDASNWVDSGGLGCSYYRKVARACQLFGNGYKNKGMTANQACCVCKQK